MPVATPTKSGHNARCWCGHTSTCVVYAINPGIHARPRIFTMVRPVHARAAGTRSSDNSKSSRRAAGASALVPLARLGPGVNLYVVANISIR